MGDGKHCPNCGNDIGVWPVFSAAWPSLIWCPRCKSRLRYGNTALVIAVLLVVLIVIAGAAFEIGLVARTDVADADLGRDRDRLMGPRPAGSDLVSAESARTGIGRPDSA